MLSPGSSMRSVSRSILAAVALTSLAAVTVCADAEEATPETKPFSLAGPLKGTHPKGARLKGTQLKSMHLKDAHLRGTHTTASAPLSGVRVHGA